MTPQLHDKTITELEEERHKKYKDYDKKSYEYFYHIILKGRQWYNQVQDKFDLSYMVDNERQYKTVFDPKYVTKFFRAMYDDYLQAILVKELENHIKSQLIHIQRANAENYLEVQRELLEQDCEIVGLDIVDYPKNFCIKYRKTKCV